MERDRGSVMRGVAIGRTRAAGMAIVFAVMAALVACGSDRSGFDADVGSAIEEVRAEVGEFRLTDHADFSWDRIVVVGPYLPPENVRQLARGQVPDSVASRVETSDHHHLLLFMDEDALERWSLVHVGRSELRFFEIENRAYLREDAVWRLDRDGTLRLAVE